MIGIRKCVAVIAFCAAACSPVDIKVEEENTTPPPAPATFSTEERLTVISTSTRADKDVLECVESALHRKLPDLKFVSHQIFRDALYPWFEPDTTPTSAEELAGLLGKSIVRDQVDALSVRYVIAVGGGTRTVTSNWGGAIGGPHAGVVVGGVSIDRETDLVAQVLDLKSALPIAEKKATVEGEGGYGIIILIPYISIPQTESAACDALAEQIASIFT